MAFSEKFLERFWSHTRKDGDCLIWTGLTNPIPLYGIFNALGDRLIAHRVAYEIFAGSIPEHGHIGRTCKNPLCVAAAHLYLQNPTKSANPAADEKKKIESHTTKLSNGCVVWDGPAPRCVALSTGTKTLARGVYELYNGLIGRGKDVVRSCETAHCLNSDHLKLVDKATLGKSNSKLTLEQVKEIRELAATGEYGLIELSERYRTSRQTIYTVVYNLGWFDPAYVPPEKMPRRPRVCRNGHSFAENLIVLENGQRKCKICYETGKRPKKTLAERFWDKVDKSAECWLWQAYKYNGWGYFSVDRIPRLAHRVAYELENGSIPIGVKVLHSCDNDSCVRPDHLYLEEKMAAK